MKVTLPNGITVEGTKSEIESILAGTEDGIHYNSGTHGRIKIKEMATKHVGNTILKMMREEIGSQKYSTRKDLLNYLKGGVGSKNVTLLALVKELGGRYDD